MRQKVKKPCGHDFAGNNKKKCGICGKRRPARVSGKPSWAGGQGAGAWHTDVKQDTSYLPPWKLLD